MKLLVLIVFSMFTYSFCLCKLKTKTKSIENIQPTPKPHVQSNPVQPTTKHAKIKPVIHNHAQPTPVRPNPKLSCKGTNGQTYNSGQTYTVGCLQYLCGDDGKLNVEIDPTCCLHEGRYYQMGEVVAEISHGEGCILEHTVCKDTGHIMIEPVYGKCNCEHNGIIVKEGENVTLSSGGEASCCSGLMVTPINKTLLNSGVKLVGGIKPGMGDVYLNEIPVRDCNWDIQAASILCQDLGFGDAIETPHRIKKYSNKDSNLKNISIECNGDEVSIDHCMVTDDCKSEGVASVRCSRVKRNEDGQVFLDGEPLCIEGSMQMEASALCRELGFSTGTLNGWKSEIAGSSSKKLSCPDFLLSKCSISDCGTNSPLANLTCDLKMEMNIQLLSGNGENEGNVYFREGPNEPFGPVCDDNFDLNDANVICREIGFDHAEKALKKSYFGLVELPFALDNVNCHGNESSLFGCEALGPEKSNCKENEGAGVICAIKTHSRKKRSAATVLQAIDTGSKIVGSVMNYFSEKEKQHQAYLKERPDMVDLTNDKLSIKMKPQKGYLDSTGEFNPGGFKLDIGTESPPQKQNKEGGPAFTYSQGIGPMLMNGCFGSNYQVGDPCYAAKRQSTKCLNMIESANFVGVGFDGTGEYTHASRKKSLIQRQCAAKSTYQGEDVPDNMNIFGIYDTACTGTQHDDLEARSESQRKQSDMGSNKDTLRYKSGSHTSVDGSISWGGITGEINAHYKSQQEKQTQTKFERRQKGGATNNDETTRTMIFEFKCSIRRYNIFLDEITPSMLSEAFLQDYMSLPFGYYSYRERAPQRYSRFLQRWGTHYIKSASFGGKFTLLRESRMHASEDKIEWQERVQEDTSQMFESKESSVDAKAGYGPTLAGFEGKATVDTSNKQNADSTAESSKNETFQNTMNKKVSSYSMDDIIVEGGDHKVASILADKHRAGFKAEFQDWLESIPKYPKGYDFVFGELTELLDMNYQSLLNNEFDPCWKYKDSYEPYDLTDERGKSVCGDFKCFYKIPVKNDDGDEVLEVRKCEFRDATEFQRKMDRKLLSLKRAIDIFIKNGGGTTTEVTIPGGISQCENHNVTRNGISYSELINGETYRVDFDLTENIGREIGKSEIFYISFKYDDNEDEKVNVGRWTVDDLYSNSFAGQYSKQIKVDEAIKEKIVLINGVRFSYESGKSGNYLKMTEPDCENNKKRIKSMKIQNCIEEEDLYWINVPLATVQPIKKPETFYPCYLKWSNGNTLMSNSSCVRFTATSEGPFYFALSPIPNRPDTMYYLRISSTDVTIYKNRELLDIKTDQISSVGLGHKDIFQSYIVCSEYKKDDNQNPYTRITYGKLGADETLNMDASFNAYLILTDDNSPIEPTFFAFGSGEYEVQIVDLELLDLPATPKIVCLGDTIESNGHCVQACKKYEIGEVSKQEVDVKCYREGSNEEYDSNSTFVPEGSYCLAICPEGEVAYPTRTVCKGDSSWSDELNCHKECDINDPAITRGQLFLNGKEESNSTLLRDVKLDCPNQKDFNSLIVEGVKCEVLCGTDESGLKYNAIGEIECSDTSQWMSNSKLVSNICRSSLCSAIADIPNGHFSYSETKLALPKSNYFYEGTICTLESCEDKYKKKEPSTLTCSHGEWRHGNKEESLQCIPTNKTCISSYPSVNHGDVSCETEDKTNDGKYFGGAICNVTCDALAGYRPKDSSNSIIQCNNGVWDVTSAVCINTCPALFPTFNYGAINCDNGDKNKNGEYLHETSCNVTCQWGYQPKDGNSTIQCNNGLWTPPEPRCKEKPCSFDDAIVDHGKVVCSEASKDEFGNYLARKICAVYCNVGYELKDNHGKIQCRGGSWDYNKPVCLDTTCPARLPTIANGIPDCSGETKAESGAYPDGTTCRIRCKSGYQYKLAQKKVKSRGKKSKYRFSIHHSMKFEVKNRVQSNHISCDNRRWSTIGGCVARPCRISYASIGQGMVHCSAHDKFDSYSLMHGKMCSIACNSGYILNDSRYTKIECKYGNWVKKSTCIDYTCPAKFPTINHGSVKSCSHSKAQSGGYLSGTTCTVQCHHGYKLKNSHYSYIRCSNRIWSQLAVCVQAIHMETKRITLDKGYWGDWGAVYKCSFPHFVNKMQLKIESKQHGGDDTALNAIVLTCTDGRQISSSQQKWGDWRGTQTCPSGYIKGAMMRWESRGGDDTGGNGVRFYCTDGSSRHPGDGYWGGWGSWQACEAGSAVYGIQTKVERDQGGGDDTALNDVRFFCAKIP